jgi:hypothetical protein
LHDYGAHIGRIAPLLHDNALHQNTLTLTLAGALLLSLIACGVIHLAALLGALLLHALGIVALTIRPAGGDGS